MYIIPEISSFVFVFAIIACFNKTLASHFNNGHGYGQQYTPTYHYKPEAEDIGSEHIGSRSINSNNNYNNNQLLEDVFKLYSTRHLYNGTQIGPQIKPPQQQHPQQPSQQQQQQQNPQQQQQHQPSQQFMYQQQYSQQQYPYQGHPQQQQQQLQQHQQHPYQQYQPQGYPQQYNMYQVHSYQQPEQQKSPQSFKLKLMPTRNGNDQNSESNDDSVRSSNGMHLNTDYSGKPQHFQPFMHPQLMPQQQYNNHPFNYNGPPYDVQYYPQHYQSVDKNNWDTYTEKNEDCDKEVECCNKCKCGGMCTCGVISSDKKCCCGGKAKKRETFTENNNYNLKDPFDL